jgi:site-specific DNA recombinase
MGTTASPVTSARRARASSSPANVRELFDRVTMGRSAIQVQPSEAAEAEAGARTLTLPWTPPSPYRKREIIQGVADSKTSVRPMRANARAILLDALGDAHRWLDELLSDPVQTFEALALREGKTDRSSRMTLSLAFLAPDIVKAAVEGRLPRGYGLKRLVDLPMAWPEQWRALGLEAPTRT